MRCGRSVYVVRQRIRCCRASGANAASNSSRRRPNPSPSISMRMKNVLLGGELTYSAADRMFPLCMAMNVETEAMRPLPSGQSISRRRL
jgi:hypothetical protein